jgi:ribosomal protein L44E
MNPHWREWCKSCNKHHIVKMQPCPSCGVHETPQPVSDKVYEKCRAYYECDGCEAYRDHLR